MTVMQLCPIFSNNFCSPVVASALLNPIARKDTPYMLFYREDGAPDAELQPTISASLKTRIEADNRCAEKDSRERKRKLNELGKAPTKNNNNINRRDDEPPPGGPTFTPNYIS